MIHSICMYGCGLSSSFRNIPGRFLYKHNRHRFGVQRWACSKNKLGKVRLFRITLRFDGDKNACLGLIVAQGLFRVEVSSVQNIFCRWIFHWIVSWRRPRFRSRIHFSALSARKWWRTRSGRWTRTCSSGRRSRSGSAAGTGPTPWPTSSCTPWCWRRTGRSAQQLRSTCEWGQKSRAARWGCAPKAALSNSWYNFKSLVLGGIDFSDMIHNGIWKRLPRSAFFKINNIELVFFLFISLSPLDRSTQDFRWI